MNDAVKGFLLVVLTAFFVIAVIYLAVAEQPVPDDAIIRTTEDGISYSIIYIENMPCVYIHGQTGAGNSRSEYAGIDCDWSKHPSNLVAPQGSDEQ